MERELSPASSFSKEENRQPQSSEGDMEGTLHPRPLESREGYLSGMKHTASCSSFPPPKKRHITPKARPKKMQEVLQKLQSEAPSSPASVSAPVSVSASPPMSSAADSEAPACAEATLCAGRSFDEVMAAAGIDTSQPLPDSSRPRKGAVGRTVENQRRPASTGRMQEKADEKKGGDVSLEKFVPSRPASAVSTAGGSSPLSDGSALTVSGCPTPPLRIPESERERKKDGNEEHLENFQVANEPRLSPDASPRFSGGETENSPAALHDSPSACSLSSSLSSSSSLPSSSLSLPSSVPQSSSSVSVGSSALENEGGEQEEAHAAIPLSVRLSSKTVKQRLHGCEELLQRFLSHPEKSTETFLHVQGGTLERLLKDSNSLVLGKVVDFLLAYVRTVTGANGGSACADQTPGGLPPSTNAVSLSAERGVNLLQTIAPLVVQNILPNPRLAPQATELLCLLAAVHAECLSALVSLVAAGNAKLLSEKKGNVALLKGAAIKQLGAALQLLHTVLEDFGAAAVNAAGGLKQLLDKSVGPFCCVSEKKVRDVCTSLTAHAVWLAGASETAKKLATEAVKNSKSMQADVLARLAEKDGVELEQPKRTFLLGGAREPSGDLEDRREEASRKTEGDGRVLLAEETDVLKLVCQHGDWVQRAANGTQKKTAGNAQESGESQLPWKIKMQAWQQLEEALRDCVCMAKKNSFLPSLLSLIHRCLTLEPTLPVVSCCLRVMQHLVRHLLSDLSAAAFSSFSSSGSSTPQQLLRGLLPDVAAKLKVNNRQVQVAATSCLGAFLRVLPLDVACAELLPMKEKLAGYRQALLEALCAAIPADEPQKADENEPRFAARGAAFWRAAPLLVQAAKVGADDGASGVRTAALQLLAHIGSKGEGGRAAVSCVLDSLQEQKRQQVLKLMATSSSASPPSSSLSSLSAVSGSRKLLGRASPMLGGAESGKKTGASASRSPKLGAERGQGVEAESSDCGREEKKFGGQADEAGRLRERKDGAAQNRVSLSTRGRTDGLASGRPHTARSALRRASPAASSSSCSSSSSAFSASFPASPSSPVAFTLSWEVPDCPASFDEAELIAERLWSEEICVGLRSPNGLLRRSACERLAAWWRRPCECRACAAMLEAREKKDSQNDTEGEKGEMEGEKDEMEAKKEMADEGKNEECLQRRKVECAVPLVLFMRMKLANFREKSLVVQEAVLACLAAAVETLALAVKSRESTKAETPITVASACDGQKAKAKKTQDTRQMVHPALAPLILAPLLDKVRLAYERTFQKELTLTQIRDKVDSRHDRLGNPRARRRS
ncbi:HEAT repeat-containing protein, partial [Toxoplasma gondii CAST]